MMKVAFQGGNSGGFLVDKLNQKKKGNPEIIQVVKKNCDNGNQTKYNTRDILENYMELGDQMFTT